MNLLDLPAEILDNVLNELDWRDLLRSATTCKTFHDAILSSSSLQYKVELGCGGLQDDCHCPTCRTQSMPERKQRLLSLVQGWKGGTVRQHVVVPLAAWDSWTYELQGGKFARASMSGPGGVHTNSEIEVVDLPSALHPRSWGIRRYRCDFEVHDFSFNVEEDLAVLFEWPGVDPVTSVVHIYLKSLSSMEDHPEAKGPTILYDLRWTMRPIEWTVHTIQIAGDLLGCLFEPGSVLECTRVAFFNWRTGALVAELSSTPTMGLDSLALLSDSIFVVPDSRAMTVYVFSLTGGPVPELVKSFSLPPLPDGNLGGIFPLAGRTVPLPRGVRLSRIVCRSDPAAAATAYSHPEAGKDHPSPDSEQPANPHFRVTNDRRVLCFILDFRALHNDERVSLAYLFTPLSTFLPSPSYKPELEAPVPWVDWIPDRTRAISMDELAINSFVTFIHGSRFVMIGERDDLSLDDWDGLCQWIHILDFNQVAAVRTMRSPEYNASENIQEDNIYNVSVVTEPSSLPSHSYFKEDVETGLFYGHVSFTIRGECEGLMVDGENVLAMVRGDDNHPNLLIMQIGSLPSRV